MSPLLPHHLNVRAQQLLPHGPDPVSPAQGLRLMGRRCSRHHRLLRHTFVQLHHPGCLRVQVMLCGSATTCIRSSLPAPLPECAARYADQVTSLCSTAGAANHLDDNRWFVRGVRLTPGHGSCSGWQHITTLWCGPLQKCPKGLQLRYHYMHKEGTHALMHAFQPHSCEPLISGSVQSLPCVPL